MHATLTVEETAYLLRYNSETIREMLRARILKGFGRPYRLPVAQFEAMGMTQKTIMECLRARTSTGEQS